MIIKMQVNGNGWEVIDNLKDVEYYIIDENCASSHDKDIGLPMNPVNYDEVYYGNSSEESFPTSVFVKAYRESGRSVGIMANLAVYLLNDNGKTIEKLN